MMDELKPCPFCNYQNRLKKVHIISRRLPFWWYIECDNCHACGETKLFFAEQSKHGTGGLKMANEKRLIDANALMKAIKDFRWYGGYPPNTLKLMFDYLKLIIRDQHTVDAVEVVHGQWRYGYCVHNGEVVYHSINCSECDGVFRDKSLEIVQHWESQFQICPFCGAKMDLEE